MSQIHVLVAATFPDLKAEGIFAAVARRADMILFENHVVPSDDIGTFLDALAPSSHCALVLVGPPGDTETIAEHWLAYRTDLVVLRVDIVGDLVRIFVRDAGLDSLFTALRQLVDRAGSSPRERVSRIQLRLRPGTGEAVPDAEIAEERPLLNAAIDWIHAVLRIAVGRLIDGKGDQPGVTVTTAAVADVLDLRPARAVKDAVSDIEAADAALSQAFAAADLRREPLAIAALHLGLSALEFRLLVLALAPELDPRYQRWIGLLMDDLTRRVGTLGLYAELLGEPWEVRNHLALSGNLARWRVFEGQAGGLPSADEPLRLDPFLRGCLIGERHALEHDPRVRRALRLVAWPGASLLDRAQDRDRASALVSRLQGPLGPQWIVFANETPAAWRAWLELGAMGQQLPLLRVDFGRLRGLDLGEIEESAIRLARMTRLSGHPMIVDATAADDNHEHDDGMRTFLAAAGHAGSPSAIIANDPAHIVRLLGPASYELEGEASGAGSRIAAMRLAAAGAETFLSEAAAEAIANQYPLQIDGLEHAMRLARTRPPAHGARDPKHERFVAACRDVLAEGSSRLAERIEPAFKLDDVVLPPDRKRQLQEIVDNVQLAPKVLDGWKFRSQLPYGRGVTALFFGPSGTGKTMAALAVARKLGVQILRIDLSRVVSKYIGDTEKNIDRVFHDAQTSCAALLIDEADALLGKRSEVNDAHDRYANIEVAYLLQRMEAYEGLAILTTNLRQNLDAAFLRRLRFIIDFPRPDMAAREEIWRRCLPDDSHTLDDAAFRQLARKIELTGGHVRQITLRAAFVAAAAGSKIGLVHVAHACRAEFAKLGLPPVDVETGERRRAA